MWILWALLSAVFAAFRRTTEKRLTTKYDRFVIGLTSQLSALPLLALVFLAHGAFYNPFSLSLTFWAMLLWIGFIFYPLNNYLYLKAIQNSELSSVLPIQSLGPVFGMITGTLLLNQSLTVAATVGLFLNVLGVYVLNLKGRLLQHPFKPFQEHEGTRYMLAGTFLQTLVGLSDRIAIRESDAIYFGFVSTVLAVMVLAAVVCCQQRISLRRLRLPLRQGGQVGMLQGMTYLFYLLALVHGPLGYVGAVRSTNIIIGSLLGIYLLKEHFSRQKKACFCLVLLGTLLIAKN